MQTNSLPETGFIRLRQIIGDKKAGVPAIVPVCASTWWSWVKTGKAPRPVKLGANTTVWLARDIRALIEQTGG
jgi:predicted DNA-binding transcriptional regulator AlpA